jgi:hypothetical protein
LSHILSTNWIDKLFLTINKLRSSKKLLCGTSSFFKVFLIEKKLEINPPDGFVILFDGCFSLMSQPHFEGSVRLPFTFLKMGLGSPLGLPKT